MGHQRCEHHLIRATLIPEIARLIAGRFDISEAEALDRFYKSATAENLADEENGLYGQPARFFFGQDLNEELALEYDKGSSRKTTSKDNTKNQSTIQFG